MWQHRATEEGWLIWCFAKLAGDGSEKVPSISSEPVAVDSAVTQRLTGSSTPFKMVLE